MELDSYENGALTIRFQYIKGEVWISISDGNRRIRFRGNEEKLFELLKDEFIGSYHFEEPNIMIETQPTIKDLIVRRIKFSPRYKRTEVKISKEKLNDLLDYLKDCF